MIQCKAFVILFNEWRKERWKGEKWWNLGEKKKFDVSSRRVCVHKALISFGFCFHLLWFQWMLGTVLLYLWSFVLLQHKKRAKDDRTRNVWGKKIHRHWRKYITHEMMMSRMKKRVLLLASLSWFGFLSFFEEYEIEIRCSFSYFVSESGPVTLTEEGSDTEDVRC